MNPVDPGTLIFLELAIGAIGVIDNNDEAKHT